MTSLTCKLAESLISMITSAIQLVLCAVIAYMFVLLAVGLFNRNVQVNHIECGHYVTDSTRGWIEVVNKNDNSRIATITIDCTHNTIESIK